MRKDVQNAIEKYGIKTFGLRKNLEKAETALTDDETVLYVTPTNVMSGPIEKMGNFTSFPGSVFVTDKRVLFCRYYKSGFVYDDLPLSKINNVKYFSNGMSPSEIQIYTSDDCYVFIDSYKPEVAQKVANLILSARKDFYFSHIFNQEFENACAFLNTVDNFFAKKLSAGEATDKLDQLMKDTSNLYPNSKYIVPMCNIQLEMLKFFADEQANISLIEKQRNVMAESLDLPTISFQNNTNNGDSANISSADEIRKYKELLDDGIITEEEFNAKKKQLLNL